MSRTSLFWAFSVLILLSACKPADCVDGRSDMEFCRSLGVECGRAAGEDRCGALREVAHCDETRSVTVELFVYTGQRNPRFESEACDVSNLVAPYCELAMPTTWSRESVYEHIGNTGMRIYHPIEDWRPATGEVYVGRGHILFTRGTDPTTCHGRLRTATSDLLASDPGFSLEKALVDMALRKGVIDERLHESIISRIDNR